MKFVLSRNKDKFCYKAVKKMQTILIAVNFSNFKSDRAGQRWWHSVTDLSVSVGNASEQIKAVRKSLRPGALTDRNASILIWVQNTALLSHRIWVSHCGRKYIIHPKSAQHTGPVIVCSVNQEPWNDSVYLLDKLVAVLVVELICIAPIGQLDLLVRQVTPVRVSLFRDQLDAFLCQWVGLLNFVIHQIRRVLPHPPLEVALCVTVVPFHILQGP